MNLKNTRLQTLITYYGVLQTLHIIVLVWAGIRRWRMGVIGFPAPPPVGGWVHQAIPFLLALAGVDLMLIVLSLVFVYGYFRKRSWYRDVGLLALGGFHASALVFGYGTIQTGAWSAHPSSYVAMVVLFVPVTVLLECMLKDIVSPVTTATNK